MNYARPVAVPMHFAGPTAKLRRQKRRSCWCTPSGITVIVCIILLFFSWYYILSEIMTPPKKPLGTTSPTQNEVNRVAPDSAAAPPPNHRADRVAMRVQKLLDENAANPEMSEEDRELARKRLSLLLDSRHMIDIERGRASTEVAGLGGGTGNTRDNQQGVFYDSIVNRTACPQDPEKSDSAANMRFLEYFTKVFRDKFDNLAWWMDEGGLIGVGRAGSVTDADDDFDIFVVPPNVTEPCQPDSLECSNEEYDAYIHRMLSVFWNDGLCVRRFHPDATQFESKRRLMFSVQLDRPRGSDPTKCFSESKPYAHVHMGVLNHRGELETNKWIPPTSTHKKDRIPLDMVLPVRRCRMGNTDAPCPNRISEYLLMRNQGEYSKPSRDGACLLVKQAWPMERKLEQVERVAQLDTCGYNSMVNLVEPFVRSGHRDC